MYNIIDHIRISNMYSLTYRYTNGIMAAREDER
jgi:hypothetical protein